MGSMRVEMGSSRGTTRYTTGWRSRDQDRQQVTRVAKAEKQHFTAIRDQCLAQGALWEDPDFPAVNRSVFYSYDPGNMFEWKRPKDISPEPRMFIGGASRFDVQQGDLGNCWFLAAVASLCASANASHGRNKYLLSRVVPEDNSFINNYGGVVHFQIWQYGRWVDVVIDDRLPTLNGKLCYMHSADDNEFWSALLEKAYAKLNGSYEALQGGCSSEAMEDFTGGICETFSFNKGVPDNMYRIMKKAYDRGSLMACTIDASPTQIEDVLPNGLVMGHAYSVTCATEIDHRGGKVQLIRVRNPWGNQYEWKGAWSDKSSEWQSLSEEQHRNLGISFDDDGEFWMDFNDFTREFHRLEICNLQPDSFEEEACKTVTSGVRRKWEASIEDGSWRSRVNAGGCRNFLDTFWTNPQYRVEVIDPDDEDDDNTGTIIIGLLQKERRKKKVEGLDMLTIGYSIYKLEDENAPLDLNFFKYNRAIARSPTFSNMREICGRHKLQPGTYCIIPSTFQPQEEGDFLLRIYSEKPNITAELDESTGFLDEESLAADEDQLKTFAYQRAPETTRTTTIVQDDGKTKTTTTTINIQAEPARIRRRAKEITQEDVDEEKHVRDLFKKTSGEELEVDAYQLREVLDAQFKDEMKLRPRFRFGGFSLETCRSLVAMMDIDHSGKLGYPEFKQLWGDLRTWKKVFKEFDQDQSGTFNSFELRQALNSAGFRVSNHTFNCLVMRYSGPQGLIYFDDYILCAARLKTMFANYKDAGGSRRQDANFTMDQFIQMTMYS